MQISNVEKRTAHFKGNSGELTSELTIGLHAPDRGILPGCLAFPRFAIDLPGIPFSSG
jgi:hypothetical protein